MPAEQLNFEPAPDGPPTSKRKGKYDALYTYLAAHPGEWVVVRNQHTSTIVTKWKARGYEARSVYLGEHAYDLYVRLPKPVGGKVKP